MHFELQNKDLEDGYDSNEDSTHHLPGKPLTPVELDSLITNSRKSGIISVQAAHESIRNNVKRIE